MGHHRRSNAYVARQPQRCLPDVRSFSPRGCGVGRGGDAGRFDEYGAGIRRQPRRGAEFGEPGSTGYSAVPMPGWNVNGTPTVVKYGTIGRFPSPLSAPAPPFPKILQFPRPGDGPPDGGAQFFGG